MKKRPMSRKAYSTLGGNARAKALPAKRRQEIARKAAKARWGRHAMNNEAPDPWNGIRAPQPTTGGDK